MKTIFTTIILLSAPIMAKDVEVYNFDTQKVYLVPQDTLGPEMIRIDLEGKIYWADSNQLTQNDFQHPPFEGELKQRILKIQKELESVNSQTYAEWEDGFRRDQNPKNEIAIWEHIASVYQKFSKKYSDAKANKEIYKIAVLCSYSEKSAVLTQANVKTISSQVAQEIIDEYYK